MLNILLNLALFFLKFIGGKLSHSVSVTSDAFNNLTDAVTTLFAWIGVKVASVGAGEHHPNGHGRFEWIIAMLASSSVVVVGWELLRDSVSAIRKPEPQLFNIFTIVVLTVSIGVKFFMFVYNRRKSVEKDSASLRAVSVDCLSDAVSTSVVLAALIINRLFDINIDGWCGVLVAFFIMYNGFEAFGETAERIMGRSAPAEDIQKLREFALEDADFSDITDIQIEDYGYGRFRASMTAIGKKGLPAGRLLADAADLKYRIFQKYGYLAQITAEPLGLEADTIKNFIDDVLSSVPYPQWDRTPLEIQSLRICDAGDYRLVQLELGIDFMNNRERNEIEKQITAKLSEAPSGYKILTQIRLKAKSGRRRRGSLWRAWGDSNTRPTA